MDGIALPQCSAMEPSVRSYRPRLTAECMTHTLRYLGRRFLPGQCWGGTPWSHISPWAGHGDNPVLPENAQTHAQMTLQELGS